MKIYLTLLVCFVCNLGFSQLCNIADPAYQWTKKDSIWVVSFIDSQNKYFTLGIDDRIDYFNEYLKNTNANAETFLLLISDLSSLKNIALETLEDKTIFIFNSSMEIVSIKDIVKFDSLIKLLKIANNRKKSTSLTQTEISNKYAHMDICFFVSYLQLSKMQRKKYYKKNKATLNVLIVKFIRSDIDSLK